MDKVGLPEYMRELAKTLKFGESLCADAQKRVMDQLGELKVKQEEEREALDGVVYSYGDLCYRMNSLYHTIERVFPIV